MTIENTIPNTTEQVPVMYVLIRDDMRYENEAVQACHAVAEYLMNHSTTYKGVKWDNGIMVYLAVKDEDMLHTYSHTLFMQGHLYSIFTEPDWGEPQHTALATIAFKGELFSELRTIKMHKGYFLGLHKYIKKISRFINRVCTYLLGEK